MVPLPRPFLTLLLVGRTGSLLIDERNCESSGA